MARVLILQRVPYEYVGVMSISAYLKQAGHQVDLLLVQGSGRFLTKIKAYHPDVIALSTMTGEHQEYLRLASRVKKVMDTPILMGGCHPTFFPEVIEHPALDMICRGEGEEAAAELCDRLDQGRDYSGVRNLWVKQDGRIHKNEIGPGENNLDNYPFLDRDIYYGKYRYLRNFPTKTYITLRGCPHSCNYCFNQEYQRLYRGKVNPLRRQSVDRVIAELAELKQRYPLKRLHFNDDVFIPDVAWLREFVPRYKSAVGLPFACNLRANLVTKEIVSLIKEAGCYLACFGVECGDGQRRRQLLNRHISDQQIYRTAELLRRYGLKMKTFNMMGLPGETLQQAVETVRLNAALKVHYPSCSILQPYPGTAIAAMAQAKGVLKADYSVDDLEKSYFSRSILKQPEIKRVVRFQKLFFLSIKMPWAIPLFRFLTRLPLGVLFDGIFGLSFVYRSSREFHTGWLNALRFAYRHCKNL